LSRFNAVLIRLAAECGSGCPSCAEGQAEQQLPSSLPLFLLFGYHPGAEKVFSENNEYRLLRSRYT
jgi:hypothetical protein